uniref:Thymidylate kinase-like protein n=1 Tax=Kitasatospora sp. NRRL F-6133 TaxID=1415539 RepID=U5YNE3_9ACTN|nr:thymidylate kinase-like protein [Kitasatospora sp. NRRL F-6133]
MLVTVVGTDGVGKSTVSRLVAERLSAQGHPVDRIDRWDIVDNPQYPAARLLRPDVPDARACVAEMENPARFLFLMWSIGHALMGRRTAAAPGAVTLLDGYWMKHAACEIVYGLDAAWTEAVVAALPRADAVLHLRLDPEQAWQRKCDGDLVPYECGMDDSCSRDSFLRHQRKVREVLDGWSARFGWTEVDAGAPLDRVVAAVGELAVAAAGSALREGAGR